MAEAGQCALCQQKLTKWVSCLCGARMHVECLAQDWLKVRVDIPGLLLAGSSVSPSIGLPHVGSRCHAPVLKRETMCLPQPHGLGTLVRASRPLQSVFVCLQVDCSTTKLPTSGRCPSCGRESSWVDMLARGAAVKWRQKRAAK